MRHPFFAGMFLLGKHAPKAYCSPNGQAPPTAGEPEFLQNPSSLTHHPSLPSMPLKNVVLTSSRPSAPLTNAPLSMHGPRFLQPVGIQCPSRSKVLKPFLFFSIMQNPRGSASAQPPCANRAQQYPSSAFLPLKKMEGPLVHGSLQW